jgi:hypothetical protein
MTTDEHAYTYDAERVILYALGVGAKRSELDYLYEGRGPRVLPTFAVVPAYDALHEALGRTGGTLENIVHGHQRVTVHQPLPPKGTVRSTCTVAALYDLKRMAQAVLTTRTTDADGRLLVETEWGILFLGEGGWGGALSMWNSRSLNTLVIKMLIDSVLSCTTFSFSGEKVASQVRLAFLFPHFSMALTSSSLNRAMLMLLILCPKPRCRPAHWSHTKMPKSSTTLLLRPFR